MQQIFVDMICPRRVGAKLDIQLVSHDFNPRILLFVVIIFFQARDEHQQNAQDPRLSKRDALVAERPAVGLFLVGSLRWSDRRFK